MCHPQNREISERTPDHRNQAEEQDSLNTIRRIRRLLQPTARRMPNSRVFETDMIIVFMTPTAPMMIASARSRW
ncbi:MAG: hypothetical protein R2849_05620 [Thermomicrobiales bacterium]